MEKTVIMSLGGSVIAPDNIDIKFLKEFKCIVENFVKKSHKFAIYCGGGITARNYQKAASKIIKLNNEELDWLGIYATKLNAYLMKAIFKENAEDIIVENPTENIAFEKKIIIAAGWLPGCSTDYDAVLLAKNLKINTIINMSNVDYVYDADPKKNKDAKIFENMAWHQYRKIAGRKWKAGLNMPFDPIAAKEAENSKLKVYIIGKDLKNFENLLNNKKFKGTVIE
ncbi:UMP kinase [Candidatus Woesearchaeota archaeon]|nr:UMP kinase [Candidatus Woesearchaeota archaeon]